MEVLFILIAYFFGFVVGGNVIGIQYDDNWQCTQSIVVSKELPRQEECVQYSRREKL